MPPNQSSEKYQGCPYVHINRHSLSKPGEYTHLQSASLKREVIEYVAPGRQQIIHPAVSLRQLDVLRERMVHQDTRLRVLRSGRRGMVKGKRGSGYAKGGTEKYSSQYSAEGQKGGMIRPKEAQS